jgi:flagellar basal-body rod protein FlgG
MDRALFAAATGMAAQQQQLDTIANNLANADVTGFKGSSDEFAALAAPGIAASGTVRTGERADLTQGKLERSDGPFDLAIDGEGFFAVEKDGRRAYTRDGAFERSPDGSMRNALGWALHGIRVPADARALHVAENGDVTVTTQNGSKRIGRIGLSVFPAPEHLRSLDGALFAQTPESGAPHTIAPGGDGAQLRFGMLERSNVSVVESMMAILTAQRAYEANAKGIQAADEMLRIANNLQRS